MSKRTHLILSATALAGMLLAACGGGVPPSGGSLKVVSDLPMSGAALARTQSLVNAITQAFEEKNYQVCNGRFTIQYFPINDASQMPETWDPDVIRQNAAVYAADQSIVAVIGAFTSDASKIMIPILNPEHLVMISPSNTYPGLTRPGHGQEGEPDRYYLSGPRNFARVIPTEDRQGVVAAEWARELGAAQVFVVDDQEIYGRGIAGVFEQAAREQGLAVLGRESIDPQAASYDALAAKINGLGPDLVYYGGITRNNAGQLFKDLRKTGYPGLFMGPDGIFEQAFIQEAGQAAEGVYLTFGGVPPEQLAGRAAEWHAGYRSKFGSTPEMNGVYGYVAATLLVHAFERVCAAGGNPADRETVRRAVFETRDFDSILGKFSIDPNGDTTLLTLSGWRIRNGKFEFATLLGNR